MVRLVVSLGWLYLNLHKTIQYIFNIFFLLDLNQLDLILDLMLLQLNNLIQTVLNLDPFIHQPIIIPFKDLQIDLVLVLLLVQLYQKLFNFLYESLTLHLHLDLLNLSKIIFISMSIPLLFHNLYIIPALLIKMYLNTTIELLNMFDQRLFLVLKKLLVFVLTLSILWWTLLHVPNKYNQLLFLLVLLHLELLNTLDHMPIMLSEQSTERTNPLHIV